MMLVGATALSVEISTKRCVPCRSAAVATMCVPKTLFVIASTALSSMSGTCLCAAACSTTSGLNVLNTDSIRSASRTSAMIDVVGTCGKLPPYELLDVEDAVLAVPEQHQPVWLRVRDLPAQLRADGAAGPGDEHGLATYVGGGIVQPIVVGQVAPPEQVRNLHRAQPADADASAEQLVDTRHGAAAEPSAWHRSATARTASPEERGIAITTSSMPASAMTSLERQEVAQDNGSVDALAPLGAIVVEEARPGSFRAADCAASRARPWCRLLRRR